MQTVVIQVSVYIELAVLFFFHPAVAEPGERSPHITLPIISSLPTLSPSLNCLHESASSGHLACAARGKSSKRRRRSSLSQLQLPQRQMSVMRNIPPKAEVLPLQIPSANFPIAPDGEYSSYTVHA